MSTQRIPDISKQVPHRRAEWSQDGGRVTVVKVRRGAFRRSVLRVFGIPGELKVHLDPLGSEVWLQIDGVRTVADLKAHLHEKFPEETNLAPRLGQFFSLMVSKGLVELT